MGDRRRDVLVMDAEPEAPAARRAAARRKIIGRLLLDGGTVEAPLVRPSLALELPLAARPHRARTKRAR